STLEQIWWMAVNVSSVRLGNVYIPNVISGRASPCWSSLENTIRIYSFTMIRLEAVVSIIVCDKSAGSYSGGYIARPMKIVVVNFSASSPAITAYLSSMTRRDSVIRMIVAKHPTSTLIVVNITGIVVAARVIDAVVLYKNELLAAIIWRISQRTVAVLSSPSPIWHSHIYRLRRVV